MNAADAVGLVLAAGASTRMGARRNKLLEEVGGRALVTIPIEAMRTAGVSRVVVVLGHDAMRVRAVLPERVECVVHAGFEAGMGSSLAFGAAHVRRAFPAMALLACVADLPDLDAEPVRRVLEARDVSRPDQIVAPVHDGRRGHPVLFGPARLDELARLEGDVGARRVIEGAGAALDLVDVATAAIHRDLDTPAAFDAHRARSDRSV